MSQNTLGRLAITAFLAFALVACATKNDSSPERTAVMPISLEDPIVTDFTPRRAALSPDGRWNAVWMTESPRSSTPGHLVMADLENERYFELVAFKDLVFVTLSWPEGERLNVFDSMSNGRGWQVDFSGFGESGSDGLVMSFLPSQNRPPITSYASEASINTN